MKLVCLFFFTLFFVKVTSGQVITNTDIIEEFEQSSDTTFIDELSRFSLYIETIKKIKGKQTILSRATGFIYKKNEEYYLITNWHVVTGKNPYTLEEIIKNGVNLSNPEKLRIYFHGNTLGDWKPYEVNLYKKNVPVWLEHPKKSEVDVVAVPFKMRVVDQLIRKLYSINEIKSNEEMLLSPSTNVSIIGFPFGFTTLGKFPIWKTGQIASDYDIDINDLPLFYIDAATRPGMSGSPVICKTNSYLTKKGFVMSMGYAQKFLGIYSGRLPNDSDIGKVWKTRCIDEILD